MIRPDPKGLAVEEKAKLKTHIVYPMILRYSMCFQFGFFFEGYSSYEEEAGSYEDIEKASSIKLALSFFLFLLCVSCTIASLRLYFLENVSDRKVEKLGSYSDWLKEANSRIDVVRV